MGLHKRSAGRINSFQLAPNASCYVHRIFSFNGWEYVSKNQFSDRRSVNSETTNSSSSGYRWINCSIVDLISLLHQKPCQFPCSWRYAHWIFPLSSIRTRATRSLYRYTSYILIDLCNSPDHRIPTYTILSSFLYRHIFCGHEFHERRRSDSHSSL